MLGERGGHLLPGLAVLPAGDQGEHLEGMRKGPRRRSRPQVPEASREKAWSWACAWWTGLQRAAGAGAAPLGRREDSPGLAAQGRGQWLAQDWHVLVGGRRSGGEGAQGGWGPVRACVPVRACACLCVLVHACACLCVWGAGSASGAYLGF